MDLRWAGSYHNKINQLQSLLNDELTDETFKKSTSDDFFSIHVCQSCPKPNTHFWYVENQRDNSLEDNIEYYLQLKQNNNIDHVVIKSLSYSPLCGYVHAHINEINNVIFFKHEIEIDLQLVEKIAEYKIYANN